MNDQIFYDVTQALIIIILSCCAVTVFMTITEMIFYKIKYKWTFIKYLNEKSYPSVNKKDDY